MKNNSHNYDDNDFNLADHEIDHLVHSKQIYLSSLIGSLSDLITSNGSLSTGIYENIKDIITSSRVTPLNRSDEFHVILSQRKDVFMDQEFPPSKQNLDIIRQMLQKILKQVSWFQVSDFFKNTEFYIFNSFAISNQVFVSKGFSHIIDSLSCLSTQPGLVIRLFGYTQVTESGIYSFWLNLNGEWTNYLLDQHVPVFVNHEDQSRFLFSSPHPQRKEVWYLMAEKALAKAYKGYHNLYNGNMNDTLRDLTGAPTLSYPICIIPRGQVLTPDDHERIDDIWNKLQKNLKKGFVCYLVPREPTDEEKQLSQGLKIHNKVYHISDGIYGNHNYSIVTVQEINYGGKLVRLVKLRNAWINEVWTGNWSNTSKKWNDDFREELEYEKDKVEHGLFWMTIEDLLNYFQELNVTKCSPRNFYSYEKIQIEKNEKFSRKIILANIQKKGKYVFSVDQQDKNIFPSTQFEHSPVRLTVGKIEDAKLKILAHTSTKVSRNTYIRKLVEPGIYYILIEKESPLINEKLALILIRTPSVLKVLIMQELVM